MFYSCIGERKKSMLLSVSYSLCRFKAELQNKLLWAEVMFSLPATATNCVFLLLLFVTDKNIDFFYNFCPVYTGKKDICRFLNNVKNSKWQMEQGCA